MQIRTSRVVRKGKTYEYSQLVESFRRPSDGTPTHRVLASLSDLSAMQVANLKTAIAANREGKRVVVARVGRASASVPKIIANLRYLDLAVLLELWKEWGLSEILDEIWPTSEAVLAPTAVVAALTLQRCVAPGSKLFATQWLPRSALPELLGIDPIQFNNTRVHRVLDELDLAGPALMARLPRRYQTHDGSFTSLFLDVTDTWFVGDGPDLAQRGKTKEGLVLRKIGIVLLCNEHGFPLRWEVVQGACHDSKSMTAMIEAVAKLSWVGTAPIVCDRAMGKTAQIRTLATSGLRFLTALTITEFSSYSERIPQLDVVEGVDPADAAIAAGMNKVEDNLYVMDMGTIERTERAPKTDRTVDASPQQVMRIARQIFDWVNGGQHTSLAAAGRALGIGKSLVSKYCCLCNLDESLQRDVLEGKADHCSLADLIAIARLSVDDQWEAFRALALLVTRKAKPERPQREERTTEILTSFTVRVLVYFNPERFVEKRARAESHLDEIRSFVSELNATLAGPRSRRTRESIVAAIDRYLRDYDLLGAFEPSITEHKVAERIHYSVALELNKTEWKRRRRYDGFTVLVAHPSLTESAAELCRLYRAKDVVEKDFQVIKGIVELRPVHHRTDGKVRAHVTLCMLALLLERTLHRRLDGLHSAKAALELLAPCHLNRLSVAEKVFYSLTEPTPDQRDIVAALQLPHLVTEDAVDRLTPR